MKIEIQCPHCNGKVEADPGALLASSTVTDARRKAARENGKKGGRPMHGKTQSD